MTANHDLSGDMGQCLGQGAPLETISRLVFRIDMTLNASMDENKIIVLMKVLATLLKETDVSFRNDWS